MYSSPASTTGISWILVSFRSVVKHSRHSAASAHRGFGGSILLQYRWDTPEDQENL